MKFDQFIPQGRKMAQAQPAPNKLRDTTPGHQPMAGPAMPTHPTLVAPASNKPHHRSSSLAKSKTKTSKHVIPPAQFTGRAKPSAKD